MDMRIRLNFYYNNEQLLGILTNIS